MPISSQNYRLINKISNLTTSTSLLGKKVSSNILNLLNPDFGSFFIFGKISIFLTFFVIIKFFPNHSGYFEDFSVNVIFCIFTLTTSQNIIFMTEIVIRLTLILKLFIGQSNTLLQDTITEQFFIYSPTLGPTHNCPEHRF